MKENFVKFLSTAQDKNILNYIKRYLVTSSSLYLRRSLFGRYLTKWEEKCFLNSVYRWIKSKLYAGVSICNFPRVHCLISSRYIFCRKSLSSLEINFLHNFYKFIGHSYAAMWVSATQLQTPHLYSLENKYSNKYFLCLAVEVWSVSRFPLSKLL